MKRLDTFRSNLSEGISRTDLMDVDIKPCLKMPKENTEFLTFRCESADLPGKTFSTDNRKTYVITTKHPNGMTFTDLNLTFICSSNMKEREFFDKWMEIIVGNGSLKSNYYDDFVSENLTVNLYKGQGKEKSCRFTFHKVYPLAISSQNVSWATSDVLKLTVNFSYEKWSVEYYKQVQKK